MCIKLRIIIGKMKNKKFSVTLKHILNIWRKNVSPLLKYHCFNFILINEIHVMFYLG